MTSQGTALDDGNVVEDRKLAQVRHLRAEAADGFRGVGLEPPEHGLHTPAVWTSCLFCSDKSRSLVYADAELKTTVTVADPAAHVKLLFFVYVECADLAQLGIDRCVKVFAIHICKSHEERSVKQRCQKRVLAKTLPVPTTDITKYR